SKNLKERWHMLKTEHHCFHYTIRSLKRIIERSNFYISAVRTYSGYAPSALQLRLIEAHFYDQRIGSIRPIRSIAARSNRILRPLLNKLTDWRLEGAEIQILARAYQ